MFTDHDRLRDELNEKVIFLISIFVAAIVLPTAGDPKHPAVDIIILEQIFFGSTYTVFVDGHIIDNLERTYSFWGTLFKSAIPAGMIALSMWF